MSASVIRGLFRALAFVVLTFARSLLCIVIFWTLFPSLLVTECVVSQIRCKLIHGGIGWYAGIISKYIMSHFRGVRFECLAEQ